MGFRVVASSLLGLGQGSVFIRFIVSRPAWSPSRGSALPHGRAQNVAVLVSASMPVPFMSVVPFLQHSWAENPPTELPVSEAWSAKLIELVEHLVKHSKGAYLVSTTLMRGPADMLATAMGDELMCVSMYRDPEETKQVLELCTELFIKIGGAQLDRTPPFEGGYVNMFYLWTPGTSILTQNGSSSQLSPRLYEQFILLCDEADRVHKPGG